MFRLNGWVFGVGVVSSLALSGCGGSDCGEGTAERDGVCVSSGNETEILCGAGTRLEDGECLPVASGGGVSCGAGTMLVDGECMASRICGTDTTEENGACVPANTVCAAGTTFNPGTGKCESSAAAQCGAGTVDVGGECVPDYSVVCAPGTVEGIDGCVPSARVQVVHMAADPAASTVDVWVADADGSDAVKLIDDFVFRTATPYLDLLPGTYDIRVAPADSETYADTLDAGELDDLVVPEGLTAQIVARGVLDDTDFDTSNGDISFTLDVIADARTRDSTPGDGDFEVRVLHASTDAPAVDIDGGGFNLLDVAYGANSGGSYIPLGPELFDAPVAFDILLSASGARFRSYQSSVAGAFPATTGGIPHDVVALVIANGFVDPSANAGGPGFDLHAVLPDGTVAPLDRAARLQLIHNAAGVSEVDLYATPAGEALEPASNPPLTLNYLEATSFLTLPSGLGLDITVALQGESAPQTNFAIRETGLTLAPATSGRLVAVGTAAASPDTSENAEVGPELVLVTDAVEVAADPTRVAVQLLHGVTDAPAVDVFAERVNRGRAAAEARVVDGASYRGFSAPFAVDPTDYVVSVTPDAALTPLARFSALAEDAAGESFLVMASGFLTPSNDDGGPGFALVEVDSEGNVEVLDGSAQLQLVHNSPDPAADPVDVWIGGALAFANVDYQSATPFLWVPAELDAAITAPGESMDLLPSAIDDVALVPGASYIAVAQGVVGTGFTQSPALRLTLLSEAERSATAGSVLCHVVHGSPDVLNLDVELNGDQAASDLSFGDAVVNAAEAALSGGLTVDFRQSGGGPANLATFTVPAGGLDGEAVTLLASGFQEPSNQPMGSPGLTLSIVFEDGTTAVFLPD